MSGKMNYGRSRQQTSALGMTAKVRSGSIMPEIKQADATATSPTTFEKGDIVRMLSSEETEVVRQEEHRTTRRFGTHGLPGRKITRVIVLDPRDKTGKATLPVSPESLTFIRKASK